MEQELARVSASPAQPLSAIDTSRYQEQDAPSGDDDDAAASPAAWEAPLARAYTASAYLESRHAHLGLLDALGKNVWLTANWQAEGAVLAPLERDLADAKRRVEVVNAARRRAQDAVAGELRSLEETWRRGVGRVLETEVAVEALRQEVLLIRRAQGVAE
jgi:pre-mRNA-splicing factor SPF27